MFRESQSNISRAIRYFLCHVNHIIKGIQNKDADVLLLTSTPPTQGAMGAMIKKIKSL